LDDFGVVQLCGVNYEHINLKCNLEMSNIGYLFFCKILGIMMFSFCTIGLFACLFWNIIAAFVTWIKGEGILFAIIHYICYFYLFMLISVSSDIMYGILGVKI
jgi:hypothetical protein